VSFHSGGNSEEQGLYRKLSTRRKEKRKEKTGFKRERLARFDLRTYDSAGSFRKWEKRLGGEKKKERETAALLRSGLKRKTVLYRPCRDKGIPSIPNQDQSSSPLTPFASRPRGRTGKGVKIRISKKGKERKGGRERFLRDTLRGKEKGAGGVVQFGLYLEIFFSKPEGREERTNAQIRRRRGEKSMDARRRYFRKKKKQICGLDDLHVISQIRLPSRGGGGETASNQKTLRRGQNGKREKKVP